MEIKSEYKEILEAIDGAGPSSAKQLIDMVAYTEDREVIRVDLDAMARNDLVFKYGNGQWQIKEKGRRKLAASMEEEKPVGSFAKPESIERAKEMQSVKHKRVNAKHISTKPKAIEELEGLTLRRKVNNLDKNWWFLVS